MYSIRKATMNDIDEIVEVYNSNKKFLTNHLGIELVDNSFITNEMADMRSANFLSHVIVEDQTDAVIGVIDYKPDSTVYLSLVMINSRFQGKGVGDFVYNLFEEKMLKCKKRSIRIDVVNDYDGNVIDFWRAQGFVAENEIKLCWGNKQSTAIVMRKHISAK